MLTNFSNFAELMNEVPKHISVNPDHTLSSSRNIQINAPNWLVLKPIPCVQFNIESKESLATANIQPLHMLCAIVRPWLTTAKHHIKPLSSIRGWSFSPRQGRTVTLGGCSRRHGIMYRRNETAKRLLTNQYRSEHTVNVWESFSSTARRLSRISALESRAPSSPP